MDYKKKHQIAEKIKKIFGNLINTFEPSCDLNTIFKDSFSKVLDIVKIVFADENLVNRETETRNFTPADEVLNIYKSLMEKCEQLKQNHLKNDFGQKEIKEELIQMFGSIVDLGMEPHINFIYFKETMLCFLKIILIIFTNENREKNIC
jgi:hypothetical protein